MTKFTIGKVSTLVDLPAKTIRFYEKEGIIDPASRGENGYRLYTLQSVEELKLIKYARDMGLPLSQIKKLMSGCDNGDCSHSKDYIDKSISDYLLILNSKIKELEFLKNKLTKFKQQLSANSLSCIEGEYCCNIFHQLVNFKDLDKGGERS